MDIDKAITILIMNYLFRDYDPYDSDSDSEYDPDDIDEVGSIDFTSDSGEEYERWLSG